MDLPRILSHETGEYMEALINISTPGTFSDLKQNPIILELISILDKHSIKHRFVDTVVGWGNLNQDWLEFVCDIETSWSWCKLTSLTDEEWKTLYDRLTSGLIIMMIHYKTKDGEYIPHH